MSEVEWKPYTRDEVRAAAEATIKLFLSGKVQPGSYELITEKSPFVFNMSEVRETYKISEGGNLISVSEGQAQRLNKAGTKCGTVACIGGWFGATARPEEHTDLYSIMEADGLSDKEATGLDELFYSWPNRNVKPNGFNSEEDAWYDENEPEWPYYGNQIPPELAAVAIQAWLDDNYEQNPWDTAVTQYNLSK